MKNLLKILAAISFLAILMSCNITINDNSSDNEVVITNGTAYTMTDVYVVPSGNYDSNYSNSYYKTNYGNDLSSYLYTYGTVTIDLDDYTGISFYLLFIDTDGDRWAVYVTTSDSTATISLTGATFSDE